jgi:hypothetical protein
MEVVQNVRISGSSSTSSSQARILTGGLEVCELQYVWIRLVSAKKILRLEATASRFNTQAGIARSAFAQLRVPPPLLIGMRRRTKVYIGGRQEPLRGRRQPLSSRQHLSKAGGDSIRDATGNRALRVAILGAPCTSLSIAAAHCCFFSMFCGCGGKPKGQRNEMRRWKSI